MVDWISFLVVRGRDEIASRSAWCPRVDSDSTPHMIRRATLEVNAKELTPCRLKYYQPHLQEQHMYVSGILLEFDCDVLTSLRTLVACCLPIPSALAPARIWVRKPSRPPNTGNKVGSDPSDSRKNQFV